MPTNGSAQHLRRLTKLLSLTGPVLIPAKSEPGFDLSAGFATLRHQTNYFSLKKQCEGQIDERG